MQRRFAFDSYDALPQGVVLKQPLNLLERFQVELDCDGSVLLVDEVAFLDLQYLWSPLIQIIPCVL
jgi:hypothetical protein